MMNLCLIEVVATLLLHDQRRLPVTTMNWMLKVPKDRAQ